jgi:ATP-binding cassette, subfamily B, bacterial
MISKYVDRVVIDTLAVLDRSMQLRFIAIVVCLVLSSSAISIAPVFLAGVIDKSRSGPLPQSFTLLALLYIAVRFSGQILTDLRWLIINPFLYRLSYNLATAVAAGISQKSNFSVRVTESAEAITRRVAIVSKMQIGSMNVAYSVLSGLLPALCDLVIVVIVVSAVAGDVFPYLFIAGIITLMLAINFLRRRELHQTAMANEADNDVFAQYSGLISNVKLICEYKALSYFKNGLTQAVDISMTTHDALFRVKSIRGIVITVATGTAYVVVMYVASRGMMDDKVSAGEVFLLATYLDRLIQPLGNISNAINSFQTGLVSMGAGYDALDQLDGTAPRTPTRRMRRFPVSVHCTDEHATSIDITDFVKGDRIHVAGRSGAGKSTFLADMYTEMGTDCGGTVLYVPASPEVIDGTVRENIRLASDCVQDMDIRASLDTWDGICGNRRIELDEDARSLSLGERQFVAVVRAVLHRPQVLILDEALNSVDAAAEKVVLRYVVDALPETIIFLVSHRPIAGVRPNKRVQCGQWPYNSGERLRQDSPQ